jgi:folate-binding protein YgfZ
MELAARKHHRMNPDQSHTADDIGSELQALTAAAGICRRDDRLMVRMVGDDRVSFLHGMCSNDIKNLKPGMLTYALILDDHAHVIADIYPWADDDALYLDVDRGPWARTREHLEKFLVADDVEMEELEQAAVIEVVGPRSAAAVAPIVAAADGLAPWHFVKDEGRMAANLPRNGLAAFTVVVPKAQADSLLPGLIKANPGSREVSLAALEVLRVEQGFARVGVDATEKTIALEARLENGISYNKGCYVGQETVERATARGGIKKRLYGLRIAGRSPQAGATAWLDGKEVGRVSSIASSPRLGVLALGIMHHSAWKPGAAVVLKDSAGETSAVVSDLPFE